jgi:DNA-binding MarR family transcriptional regulator
MTMSKAGMTAPEAPAPATQPVHAFDLASLLGYRLQRLSSAIGALAQQESLEVSGLSLPEYRVLVVLQNLGVAGVVALQKAMLIDKAWISRTLASLVQKKLVTSQADAGDARRTLFRATAKGERAAEALMERAFQRQERILQGFSAKEVQQLLTYLDRIQANVEPDER